MDEFFVVVAIVIGLPWLVLHYLTKWKTTPTFSDQDEVTLEELYQLARRLEERLQTVERLAASEDDGFAAPAQGVRRIADRREDQASLAELDRRLKERTMR